MDLHDGMMVPPSFVFYGLFDLSFCVWLSSKQQFTVTNLGVEMFSCPGPLKCSRRYFPRFLILRLL